MSIIADTDGGAARAGTSRYAKTAIALFFVVLFIPGSVNLGVRMTPYRLYLLLLAIPMTLRFLRSPTLRLTSADVFVFLAIFWMMLSLVAVHGTGQITYAGSTFIELFFGYMLGRTFIRSETDYRFFFTCFLVSLVAFAPFAFLELTTRQRVLRDLADVVLDLPPAVTWDQIRFGLMRVMVSFEHALHFGTYCAIGFANVFYLNRASFVRRYVLCGFVLVMALLPLSSSAILFVALQIALIAYDRSLWFLPQRWVILGVASAIVVLSFQAIFSMSIPEYIVEELIISPDGGRARIEQYEYAFRQIRSTPVFGLGVHEFRLPYWRGKPSLDNFWLYIAMVHGVPALVLLALGLFAHLVRTIFARGLDPSERRLRTGYLITWVSLMLALSTYHIWGVISVFVMVYIGAGAWFYDRGGAAGSPPPRRRRPAAVPGGAPPAPASATAPRRPGLAPRPAGAARASAGAPDLRARRGLRAGPRLP